MANKYMPSLDLLNKCTIHSLQLECIFLLIHQPLLIYIFSDYRIDKCYHRHTGQHSYIPIQAAANNNSNQDPETRQTDLIAKQTRLITFPSICCNARMNNRKRAALPGLRSE